MRVRVLLADDHRMLREAFTQLLQPTCDVVGGVADGRALLAAAAELRPDVVLVDIAMPMLNGIDAARKLKRELPEIKVIFLTMNEDPDVAVEALRVGASGYLLKNSAVSELLRAIHEVVAGRSYVTPLCRRTFDPDFAESPERRSGDLSTRQRDVLRLLAEGHSMKQIAGLLNITPRTVAFHKYGMMKHLGIQSSAELVQFALKQHVAV